MGYYASGGGYIMFKTPLNDEQSKQVSDLLDQAWFEFTWDKDKKEVDFWPPDKYYWDTDTLLNEIAKQFPVSDGSAEFHGEDDTHWVYQYEPVGKSFLEFNGRVVYDNEDLRSSVKEDDRTEFIGQIIDVFEDFLESKGIDIPNEDKEQSEFPAIIYGMDYGEIQSGIEAIMYSWKVFQ